MIYRLEKVSGVFYKNSEKELRTQIKNCFLNKEFGPKNKPSVKKTNEFMAVICPHAGYDFSGPCAAHAYRKIGENTNPEIIVIIGPNHSGRGAGAALFPNGKWMTPLGELTVNDEFNNILLKESKEFVVDELSHSNEHSIEVQLPFLKYVYGDKCPNIVPICINAYINDIKKIKKLGEGLYKAWMESGKRVLFIASSDLSHVGQSYGFIPFKERGKELSDKVKNELDKKAIDLIKKLDVDALFKYVKEKKLTICGINAIGVLLVLLKKMKKQLNGKILSHYSSADITKDYENFVDYVSMIFKEKK